MEDDLTVVGGLVPGLLMAQDDLPEGVEPHPGTMDLDVALKLALLEVERYREVSKRLRDAGFTMDRNAARRWAAISIAVRIVAKTITRASSASIIVLTSPYLF